VRGQHAQQRVGVAERGAVLRQAGVLAQQRGRRGRQHERGAHVAAARRRRRVAGQQALEERLRARGPSPLRPAPGALA